MTLEDYILLVNDTLGPGNVVITPTELKALFAAIPSVIETEVTNALAQAATTAGTEMKTFGGGVDTVATTNIPLNSGIIDISGYPGQVGNLVLLAGQTNKSENGIYIMTTQGLERLPGYDTPQSLSRLNIGIRYGDFAGDLWQIPGTLTSLSNPITVSQLIPLSESLKDVAGAVKPEIRPDTISITGTRDDDDNFIPDNTYAIGNLVRGSEISEVFTWQSDYGNKSLDEPGQWSYDEGTGILTINDPSLLPEDGKLKFRFTTYGTHGVGHGIVLEAENGQIVYRFGNETPADNKPIGSLTVTPGITTVNTAAEAQAARTGTNAKLIVIRGKPSAATLYNPGTETEQVATHTP